MASNPTDPSRWVTRYPDLTGKTMVVVSESHPVVETTRALAGNGALLAIVAPDRDVVDQAVAIAQTYDAAVFGITADPSSAAVWSRLGSHIEQRLGPIDVVVAIAAAATRRVVLAAMLPDMAARGRGVVIEADAQVEPVPTAPGVRHRGISGGDYTAADLAAAVLLCASDTLTAGELIMTAGRQDL